MLSDDQAIALVTKKVDEDLGDGKEQKPNLEKGNKNVFSLDPPNVTDVLDDGDQLVYLTTTNEIVEKVVADGITYSPPPKADMPYAFADKELVMNLIRGSSDSSDAELYTRLLDYHKRISDLPNELYYDLLALWDFHTYLIEKFHFSPIFYLYAVKERGKSRTGKGCLYVSRRGIFTETVREADIIRWGNDHKAAIGFDVKDFPKKIERANCEDLILARFEKGSTSSRTLWPEKGAFKDTKTFRLFGPTIVMTNRPVDDILESRAISIDMKPSTNNFNNPVTPEDALELKARLVAFRVRHWKTTLKKSDKPTTGRLGDILSPLQQIVHTFFPERMNRFNELLTLVIEKKKEEAIDTFDAQVVDAVRRAEQEVVDGFLAIEAVSKLFNEGKEEKYVVKNETIGRSLRALGFSPRRTTGGKRGFYYDPELVKKLIIQYGLSGVSDSMSLPSLPVDKDENPTTNEFKSDSENYELGEDI